MTMRWTDAPNLYELVGKDRRARSAVLLAHAFALAHKGLAAETIPWRLSERPRSPRTGRSGCSAARRRARDRRFLGDRPLPRADLFRIALAVRRRGGEAATRFLNGWGDAVVIRGILPFVLVDACRCSCRGSGVFRRTREARFGRKLEEVSADRDSKVEVFRASSNRANDAEHAAFIGGQARTTATTSCSAVSSGRVRSARSGCSPRTIAHAWRETMLDLTAASREVAGISG